MRITNNLGLPEPLVKAVTGPRPKYGPKTVSVTTLARPARITGLEHAHGDEIVEDAADRLWALMGTLLHDVLEKHAEGLEDTIAEQRLNIEVGGWTVTGKYDLSEFILDGETLSDWKFTSIYSLKDNEVKPEWAFQINAYTELLKQAGRIVGTAQIVAIGRDWSKRKAERERDYPQKAVTVKPVPLWSSEKTLSILAERVRLYETALKGEWPECSPEERWARPDTWAIMKRGNKKASKLLYSEADARSWLKNILGANGAYSIQKRDGESIRCASYCPVLKFCKQGQLLTSKQTLSDALKESIHVAQERKQA